MKRKLLLLSTLSVILAFFAQPLVVKSIEGYQKYISPNKGFRCAYGVLHPDEPSCSEYGKLAIADQGVIKGTKTLYARLEQCTAEYKAHKAQKASCTDDDCCGCDTFGFCIL